MKNCYLKALLFKAAYFMVFAALTTLVYTCKKTYTEDATAPADVIAAAQAWYQNAYPHSSDGNVINGIGNKADISKFTSPNWDHANTYDRLGSHVVELPLDSTHLININTVSGTGGRYKNNSLSRSWFLILNKTGTYTAFVMTVIADSGYIKNDFKKLQNNTYQKRDKDFSGTLLYSTPTGKLLKGWQYKSGKITGVILPTVTTTGSNAVQGIGTKLKTNSISCTDWYLDYYSGETLVGSVYLGYSCVYTPDSGGGTGPDDMGFEQQDANNGGGSTFQPPPGFGGGGGSSSVTLPLTITDTLLKKTFPCATKLIIDSLLKDTAYTKLMAPFMTSGTPNLDWRDSSMSWNATTAHIYQLGLTKTTNVNRNATIFLNTSMLQNSSKLMIAATAIHESLHGLINYNLVMAGYMVADGKVDSTSWMVGVNSWFALNGLPSNFSNHFEMMDYYFAQAISALSIWDHNGHTAKEYEMAMLYGLNNPGDTTGTNATTPAQVTMLQTEYNNLMIKYGITQSDLDNFYLGQLNASAGQRLPTSGCN